MGELRRSASRDSALSDKLKIDKRGAMRLIVALLAGCLLSDARSALAQSSPGWRSVQYEAPAACPGQSEFVEQVRARMELDRTRAPADSELRVSLSERGAGIHGSLEIKRGATNTQRSVDAGSCAEVVEALALITALALRDQDAAATDASGRGKPRLHKPDKSSRSESGRRESAAERDARTHSPHAPGASPRDGQRREADRRAQATSPDARISADALGASLRDGQSREVEALDATAGAERAPNPPASGVRGRHTAAATPRDGQSREATSGDGRVQRRNARESDATSTPVGGSAHEQADDAARRAQGKVAAAAGAGPTRARNAASSESEVAGRRTTWELGGTFGATLLLFSGLAPAMQPGLQLRAAWVLRSEEVAWSLQLAARIARTDRLAAGSGAAYFGFVGGAVRVCGARALGRFALVGCAVAEPGVFSTGSDNTLNSRSHSRLWLAAGAAAELQARLASWLMLFGGGELLTPVRRDRVLLGRDTLYRVPVLGLRLQLGLEVPFG